METAKVQLPPALGDACDRGEICAVGILEYRHYSGDRVTTLAVPAKAYFCHAAVRLSRERPTPGYPNTAGMGADTITGIAT